ncbi:MAG: cytochrome c biogenesis protein CcsA [Flavobacteriales bacterium]|nr:cytochrome c biogenesis protein CcsA [Flavobacteriales bacterium]MCB9448913.1 cytochrome c biogenesis protein CcsA [Flavobacteriales bacterium]
MKEIVYNGEHLLPGIIGKSFVFLAFVAALLASASYFFATNNRQDPDKAASWSRLANIAFLTHVVGVVGIVVTLFSMIFYHMFEYHYVWQHSSSALPIRYMLSCFWEGQEGSFLLWTIWHAVIGLFLMRMKNEFRAPVMSILSVVQVFLGSMLLGVYILGYKVGSNPFILLREHSEMMNLPFVSQPNYLEHLDGRGLNPLLQNYWMTIHPPTLFLGFALTVVPFAFAISGLWIRNYGGWIKPALPWTLLGVLVLGTGILMGGAWAYEALSFGGFWAWDPVENASLVPWMTLVASLHLMLIYKSKQRSLFTTVVMVCVTFFLILYSTFLTRSGILGDASVHAFTDLGMSGQLLVYMFFFTLLAVALIISRYKHLKDPGKEEHLWSREFWMFIGSLVLLIAAFQIIFTTSTPVINKVFGTDKAPPTDPIAHYNSWQIAFAVLIALMIGFTQFLNYKHTDLKKWLHKLLPSLAVGLIGGILLSWALGFNHPQYIALMVTATFAVVANADYWLRILRGKLDHAGASIAHLGFGLILIGALISNAKQNIISQNSSAYNLDMIAKDLPNKENIMLVKNDTLKMGDYRITYTGKEKEGVHIYYNIQYLKPGADGHMSEAFTLRPLIQMNRMMGNVAEPATKHFLFKDIYTHVQYADLSEFTQPDKGENNKVTIDTLTYGDTLFAQRAMIVLDTVSRDLDRQALHLADNEIGAVIRFHAIDVDKQSHPLNPVFLISGDHFRYVEDEVASLGIKLTVKEIIPQKDAFVVELKEKEDKGAEFIIMKAIVFPFINILWLGSVLMIIGTFMAIRKRLGS